MDIALSPKLLTDFRLGYLRYHIKTAKFDGTENLATNVGIPDSTWAIHSPQVLPPSLSTM